MKQAIEMMTTSAIKFSNYGGPEVMHLQEEPLPALQDHEVLVRHEAIGVNFVDTYYRSGEYKVSFPSGLGTEAAGVVLAVGKNVNLFKEGDRVAYATGPLGSYAQMRVIDSKFLVKVPDGVSFEMAASSLLKGLTVHYLFKSVYPLERSETVLFHAAAGGVGLLACQWAKHLGVKLIGTVSSAEKAEVALRAGAWKVINYSTENVSERVSELTSGHKVPVVYDGIGKATWDVSLSCVAPKGLMVSFGNASGSVTGVNLASLAQHGSLFVTRPILAHYMNTPEALRKAAAEVFDLMKSGVLSFENVKALPLKDATQAHQELANRNRTGPLILLP
jgi:NADPH2:quinone reductase